jgi:mono/diheme cytochrome c family protein
MIGAIVAGLVIFAVGIFLLWVLVYASGLVRPKISTEAGVTGAAAMERKVLLTTGMIIATGLLLTVYGFFDPIRQVTARERQIDVAIERGSHNYATLCYSCHGVDGRGAVVPGTDPPRVAPQLNREQFAQAWQADEDTFDDVYDQVYKTIQRGRPGTPMPAWGQTDGGTLNQEQIHELTAMIVYGTREVKGHPTWQLVQELVDESIAHGAPTPIPVEAAAADVPPELRAGSEVFTRNGCAACHAVQGDARLVGPSLANISQAGATRKPGTSAEDYIRESIRDPSAFIVPTFPGPPSLMPPFTPNQIPDDQLEQLVQYLMSLK